MAYKAHNLISEKHCFFGAEGGVSSGKYASLNTNLKSRDSTENVRRNFEIIAEHFGCTLSNMCTVRQSVSKVAVLLNSPSFMQIAADGIVTKNPDLLIGIKTADCTPVLLADYKNGVIGAAHAGWRGACAGIVESTVQLMIDNGAEPQSIAAAIGPFLQKKSFDCKDDMVKTFLAQSAENNKYFSRKENGLGYLFDMGKYVEDKLKRLGVKNIVNSGIDTYADEKGYFSFRRNTHRRLIEEQYDYPTQYSCIKL